MKKYIILNSSYSTTRKVYKILSNKNIKKIKFNKNKNKTEGGLRTKDFLKNLHQPTS